MEEKMTLTYDREEDSCKMEFVGSKRVCEDGKNEKKEIIDHQIHILLLALDQLNTLRKKETRKELMLEELAK